MNTSKLFSYRLLIIGALLLLAVSPSLSAQELAAEGDAAILEMLTRHDKALSEHDLETILATFSPTRHIVLMGIGPGERWIGKEEIADAYQHFFMDFDQGSLSTECTWHSLDTQGNMAWLMAMCNFTDYLKNVKRDYAVNISAVLEEVDGQWYFVTFHFSNLTNL